MTRKENPWISLALNIVIPTVILVKFSGEGALGPVWGLVTALAFPLAYGLYDFSVSKKLNFFSAVGIVSTLLTGGIGLFELDPKYVAIKEAGVPLVVGLIIFLSVRTKYPVVKTFVHKVVDSQKIYSKLAELQKETEYEERLKKANHWFAASFFISSVLNFSLAKIIVTSQPGTEAFNAELGRMTALSYPVIALPMTIMMAAVMYSVIANVAKLTQLEFEEILAAR